MERELSVVRPLNPPPLNITQANLITPKIQPGKQKGKTNSPLKYSTNITDDGQKEVYIDLREIDDSSEGVINNSQESPPRKKQMLSIDRIEVETATLIDINKVTKNQNLSKRLISDESFGG